MKKEPVSISTLIMAVKTPMPRKASRHAASAAPSSERAGAAVEGSPAPGFDWRPISDEVEVAGGQAGLRHAPQRDHVRRVLGDDDIGPDLGGMGQQSREVSEDRVVELDHVMARSGRDEVGDRVLAEVGGEHEGVAAGAAGQGVVAGAAGQLVVAALADDQVLAGG